MFDIVLELFNVLFCACTPCPPSFSLLLWEISINPTNFNDFIFSSLKSTDVPTEVILSCLTTYNYFWHFHLTISSLLKFPAMVNFKCLIDWAPSYWVKPYSRCVCEGVSG